ncbi:Phosphoenolpyruvate guanylyltransferase [Candidatus Entotheonellaceae bacterium PAL068K]
MAPIALVIMAKAPQAGEVKTRLCPPLSPQEAAALYRGFLLDMIAKARRLHTTHPVIAYTPTSQRQMFADTAPDFPLMPQQGTDLGIRMATCFAQLFAEGYTEVLLTGSDLPTLPLAYLQQAVDLVTAPYIDVVLGPSEDGGYYLIGLRRLYSELFENMTWSTNRVLTETVQRAEARGLEVARLPVWYDIDTAADLERLQATLRSTPDNLLQHTQQFFVARRG